MTKDFIEIYSDFNFGGTIKTLDYCIGECESLAGQLSSYSNRT